MIVQKSNFFLGKRNYCVRVRRKNLNVISYAISHSKIYLTHCRNKPKRETMFDVHYNTQASAFHILW